MWITSPCGVGYSWIRVYVGLDVRSGPPSAATRPATRVVLPAPRGPSRSSSAPWGSSRARRAAKARVSVSSASVASVIAPSVVVGRRRVLFARGVFRPEQSEDVVEAVAGHELIGDRPRGSLVFDERAQHLLGLLQRALHPSAQGGRDPGEGGALAVEMVKDPPHRGDVVAVQPLDRPERRERGVEPRRDVADALFEDRV